MPACALCLAERELRESHIIPKFVFKYLKRTSATGYLRFGTQPNRRVQDGRKVPMLCEECEQRFSTLEKYFAETLFEPYTADRSAVLPYDARLLKFAASLSWRVLYYYNAHGHLGDVAAQHLPRIDRALETWRQYLLDQIPNPGGFEQHMLPMDELESATIPDLPANIHRYLLRAVDMDVVTGKRTALVYTKIPRIALVGFVEMPDATSSWKGTRLAAKHGTVRPREYVVPQKFGEYMLGQARKASAAAAAMSDQQKKVVSDTTLANLDRAAQSESLRAMARDVEMFGSAAFDRGGSDSDDP